MGHFSSCIEVTYFFVHFPDQPVWFLKARGLFLLIFAFLMPRINEQGIKQAHLPYQVDGRWMDGASAVESDILPPKIHVPPAQTLSHCLDVAPYISLLSSECGHTQCTLEILGVCPHWPS